jgi:GDPmannose 4,6-dehydratase
LHSVRELIEIAFAYADVQIEWEGEGSSERGIDSSSGKTIVSIDPKYYRPIDIDSVLGDATKAQRELGWTPEVKFDELVEIMMKADMESAQATQQD